MQKLIHLFSSSGQVSQERAKEIAAHFNHKTMLKHDFFLKERQVCNE